MLAVSGIFPKQATDEVSHLCDNSRCLRVDHLRWESRQQNSDRKNCPGWIACGCCNEMHDACVHDPKCKKVTKRQK